MAAVLGISPDTCESKIFIGKRIAGDVTKGCLVDYVPELLCWALALVSGYPDRSAVLNTSLCAVRRVMVLGWQYRLHDCTHPLGYS